MTDLITEWYVQYTKPHKEMPEYFADMFESKTRTATKNMKECALKIIPIVNLMFHVED